MKRMTVPPHPTTRLFSIFNFLDKYTPPCLGFYWGELWQFRHCMPCLNILRETNLNSKIKKYISTRQQILVTFKLMQQVSACPTLVVVVLQQQQQEAIMVTRLVDKDGDLKVNKTDNLSFYVHLRDLDI